MRAKSSWVELQGPPCWGSRSAALARLRRVRGGPWFVGALRHDRGVGEGPVRQLFDQRNLGAFRERVAPSAQHVTAVGAAGLTRQPFHADRSGIDGPELESFGNPIDADFNLECRSAVTTDEE